MPRIKDFSSGRIASARTPQELAELDKSNSIKIVDQIGDKPPELEDDPQDHIQADDASVAFQKQIDALKKSEQLARDRAEQAIKDREDAIKRANEREAEVHSLKKTTVDSQVEAVSAALAAAQSEAETAQRDIERALELGDFKGQAEAYRRLSKAETNIARLEDGKASLESQAQAAAEAKPEVHTSDDPLEKFNLPVLAKSWLRLHPEYLNNPRKNAMIQNLHYDVVDEGHEPYSQGYFESLEQHLGMRQRPQQDDQDDDPPQRNRSSMVSAPVSRDGPSSASGEKPGQVRLSALQKEAAKIAGISEKEYAEQVLRLREEKKSGNYGGAP